MFFNNVKYSFFLFLYAQGAFKPQVKQLRQFSDKPPNNLQSLADRTLLVLGLYDKIDPAKVRISIEHALAIASSSHGFCFMVSSNLRNYCGQFFAYKIFFLGVTYQLLDFV